MEEAAAAEPGLEIGVSLTGLMRQECGTDSGGDMGALFERAFGWACRAAELDVDFLSAEQQYLAAPQQVLQPMPLLSVLARHVPRVRLAMGVALPLHHPVVLAETLASLDWVSGGRLIVAGAQGCRGDELYAFGLNDRTASTRTTECLRCLMALWRAGPVTFRGAHFRLDGAQVGLRPKQRPHPPVWLRATTDRDVRRVAREGLPWHVERGADHATLVRQSELYHSEVRRPDQSLRLAREVCCAPTREEAYEIASRYLAAEYARDGDAGRLGTGRFVIGSPDDCVAELRGYLDLGVTALDARVVWPGMPDALAVRSLELFGTRVAPRLRAGARVAPR